MSKIRSDTFLGLNYEILNTEPVVFALTNKMVLNMPAF